MHVLFSRPAFFAFVLVITIVAAAAGKRGMDMDPYGRASALAPETGETLISVDP